MGASRRGCQAIRHHNAAVDRQDSLRLCEHRAGLDAGGSIQAGCFRLPGVCHLRDLTTPILYLRVASHVAHEQRTRTHADGSGLGEFSVPRRVACPLHGGLLVGVTAVLPGHAQQADDPEQDNRVWFTEWSAAGPGVVFRQKLRLAVAVGLDTAELSHRFFKPAELAADNRKYQRGDKVRRHGLQRVPEPQPPRAVHQLPAVCHFPVRGH